jgi:hypothetical protein
MQHSTQLHKQLLLLHLLLQLRAVLLQGELPTLVILLMPTLLLLRLLLLAAAVVLVLVLVVHSSKEHCRVCLLG